MILQLILPIFVLGVASSLPHTYNKLNTTENSSAEELGGLGVYDGNATKMNDHRYLVGIATQDSYLCTGIIVNMNWVVTIAECTYSYTASDLVVIGSSKDGTKGKNFTVTSIVQHPDYSYGSIDYDVSCVQVEGKFYYWHWRSHTLPTTEPAPYTTFTVTGYSYTTADETTRAVRTATMKLLPKYICKQYYDYVYLDWTRLMCAVSPDGATLCEGDFGDAFVYAKVFYGMFVAESPFGFCTSTASPVIITDVSGLADWIHGITGASYDNTTSASTETPAMDQEYWQLSDDF